MRKAVEILDFKNLMEGASESFHNFFKRIDAESKKKNPYAEIHLRAIHCNPDKGEEKEVYGQLIYVSTSNFVVHDNPWKGRRYRASMLSRDSSDWIIPTTDSISEQFRNGEFLWVRDHEIIGVEVHYPAKTNKEASFILERLDLNE